MMGVAIRIKRVQETAPDGSGEGRGTSTKRPPEARVPIIGVNAGCIPLSKPGTPVWMVEQEAHDLRVAGKELVRRKLKAARGRA